MKLFTRNAQESAKNLYANRPLNIPAMEWHNLIKEALYDDMLDELDARRVARSTAKPVQVITPTEEDIKQAKAVSAEVISFFENLKGSLIENQEVPGFIRQEVKSESHEDGLTRVVKELRKARRLAKKEGRDVKADAKVQSLMKELEVLKDENNPAIYKPELKLNLAYEYKRVSKAWLDGSPTGKGKEGHRESLGTSLVFESPVYKMEPDIDSDTGEVKLDDHGSPIMKQSFDKRIWDEYGTKVPIIVAYDVILLVDNGSLSAPAGIISMVFSFMKTLQRKGVFKNNQMITRDQYGYTYLVQDFVSDVGLDIAQNCGWVTMNSYKLMNATFYQTIRSKQQSKKVFMERQSWFGANSKLFLKFMKNEIQEAISRVLIYSDWAKSNPDYAEDIRENFGGYHREVIKYFMVANNSETLRVHNFKEKFPEEELERNGVDAQVLKELANEVRNNLRAEFGTGYKAGTEIGLELDAIRAKKDEHGFMLSFIQEEMSKNVGHKISFNLNDFREEGTDKLALVDNHGEITVPQEESDLPVALTMFDVSTSEIKDIELDEEIEKSLQ